MRHILKILILLFFGTSVFGQGINPRTLEGTSIKGGILKGNVKIYDEAIGDSVWLYTHDTLLVDTNQVRHLLNFVNNHSFSLSGTPTRIPFFNTSSSLGTSADLYWDNTRSQLGIGTTTPATYLQNGTSKGFAIHDASGDPRFSISNSTRHWLFYLMGNNLNIWANGVGELLTLSDNRRVGIYKTTPLNTLHVGGGIRMDNSTGTPTKVIGRDGNGDIGDITLGSGVSLTSGVLSATGSGGTVTSVGVANGGGLTVSGSPITTSGTITITADDTSPTNELNHSIAWNDATDSLQIVDAGGIKRVKITGFGTGDGTVESVGIATGTTGTDVNVSGSPITTSGTITVNIPTASATNRGALSSSDWSSFNSKAGGTGAANKVAFWTGTNTLSYNTNLHWDNTNGRLGIGDVSTLSARVNILAFGNAPALSIRNSSNAYQYLTVDNKGWLSGRGIKGYQITKTNGDAIPTINIAEFNDLLISAEDKYTVTYGNGGTHPNLYLNQEGINWNVTSTDNVIINFKGKSYWPSGITYPGGEIWIGFYYQTHTEDIEVYYELNTNIGTWVDISSTKEVIYLESSAYKYIKFKIPANFNYLSKLKIAINDVAQVERIRYLVDRNSENNYGSFCRKYGDLLFGTYTYRNSSNTAVNVIDCNGNNYFNSGNFGIGTASPGYRLDVNGDVRFRGRIYDSGNSSGSSGQVLTSYGAGNWGWSTPSGITGTGVNGRVAFWNGTSSLNSNNLFFWDDGNSRLGLGTNAPTARLDVDGAVRLRTSANTPTNIMGRDGSGYVANVSIGTGLSLSGGTLTNTSLAPNTWADLSGNIVSWNSTGVFNSGKPVGIGDGSPTRLLDVNGDVRFRGRIYDSGNSSGSSGQVLTSYGAGNWGWSTPSGSIQNLSYNIKSGSDVYLDISGGGAGVNLSDGKGIVLDRVASNKTTFSARLPYGSMRTTSDYTNTSVGSSEIKIPFITSTTSQCNSDVTFNSSNNRLIVGTAGVGMYRVSFECDIVNQSTNDYTLEVYARISGGSVIPASVVNKKVVTQSSVDIEHTFTKNFVIPINYNNDYIELFVKRVSGSGDKIIVKNAQLTMNFISIGGCGG